MKKSFHEKLVLDFDGWNKWVALAHLLRKLSIRKPNSKISKAWMQDYAMRNGIV